MFKFNSTKWIWLFVAIAATQAMFAAQQDEKDNVHDNNNNKSKLKHNQLKNSGQLPPIMNVPNNTNAKPKAVFKKLGPKKMEQVVLNAGKEVSTETAMAFQIMKNIGLNSDYGFGGISTGTLYTHYAVLEIPMLGEDKKFVNHWNTIHGGMSEDDKAWVQKYMYPDIFLELFTVRGKDAIKNWAQRGKKFEDHKTEVEKFKLNEDAKLQAAKNKAKFDFAQKKQDTLLRDEEGRKWWDRTVKGISSLADLAVKGLAAWPQYKAQVRLLLAFVVWFWLSLYLGYKIIAIGLPALKEWAFDDKRIIVKSQRLSWHLWGTNRVFWHSKRVKSNIEELHYANDMKRWVDNSVAEDKKRVAANRVRKGEFNFATILLKGNPGTGKTALAQAYAAAAGMDFIHIGGSSWSQLSEADAIDDFKKTIRRANNNPIPVLIFIDEIDVIFPKRAKTTGVARKITSTFLEEIDKAYNANIKFIFATNLQEELSPAIRSRCGEEIEVLPPSETNCQRIYSTYMGKYSKKHRLTCEKVDIKLFGLTGRDIELVCLMLAEATRLDNRTIIRAQDIQRAFAFKLSTARKKNNEKIKRAQQISEARVTKTSSKKEETTEAGPKKEKIEEIKKKEGQNKEGGSWPLEYIIGGIIALIFTLFGIFFILRRKKEEF